MFVNFELTDITELIDDHWSSDDEPALYIFTCNFSDTALFIIKKIIKEFQYQITTSFEMSDGNTAFETNIPYDRIVDVCPGCSNELCNRFHVSDGEPENDDDNDNSRCN